MAVKTEDKAPPHPFGGPRLLRGKGLCRHPNGRHRPQRGRRQGTIYNYFKGKEELLHALAEGIAGVMHRNLENVTSSKNEGLPLKDRLMMKVVAPLTDGTAAALEAQPARFPTRGPRACARPRSCTTLLREALRACLQK